MNLAEMVKNVNAECQPITDIDVIIKRWINQGQKVLASKAPNEGWFFLTQYGYSVTTTSGDDTVVLSPLVDCSKIINFRDESTPRYISNMSEERFRRFEPGPTSTGDAYIYRLVGFSPVQNQPTSSSQLTLVSSSASDTSVDVNVGGLDGSGVYVNEAVTLNGTSSVTTTNSYTKVMILSKDAISVGKVTITSNAAAVTNVVIAPKDRYVSHPVVKLHSIPDGTNTLYYDFIMKLPDITADDDCSIIPEQYHDVIELYAIHRCWNHLKELNASQLAYSLFESRINDMKMNQKRPSGILIRDSYETEYVEGPFLPSTFPRGS